MLEFRFSNEPSAAHTDAVANRLIQPRLWIPHGDYPGHMEWRDKALADVEAGKKRAMVAFWGSEPVGLVVYQRAPDRPAVLEIKNISVEPAVRGRHVASFLLRQTEIEGAVDFPGVTHATGDTKMTNLGIMHFLLRQDYSLSRPMHVETNYAQTNTPDIVFTKSLVR